MFGKQENNLSNSSSTPTFVSARNMDWHQDQQQQTNANNIIVPMSGINSQQDHTFLQLNQYQQQNWQEMNPSNIITTTSPLSTNAETTSYRVGGTPQSPECVLSIHRHSHSHSNSRSPVPTYSGLSGIEENNNRQQVIVSARKSNNNNNNNLTPAWNPSPSNNTTALDQSGLQKQQMEIRCGSASGEQHKVVVDSGDAPYTLLILDCSPTPQNVDHCRSGECASRCHCQTELIVKQIHEHCNCQHQQHSIQCQQSQQQQQQYQQYLQPQQQSQLQQQQQQYQQQQQQQQHQQHKPLAIEHYPTSPLQNVTIEQTLESDNYNQRRHYQQFSPQQQQQQQQQQQFQPRQLSTPREPFYNSEKITYVRQGSPRSGSSNNYQNNQQHYQQQFNQYQEPEQQAQNQFQQNQNQNQSNNWTQFDQDSNQQQQQQYFQQQEQKKEPEMKPKPGFRFVKRWDWNQAQFITTEVPENPSPRPQLSSSSMGEPDQKQTSTSRATTDVWHQDYLIPRQPLKAANFNQQKQPQQLEIDHEKQQPWLDYRIPDIESVQSDPLYRDLLFELQRLDEGVSAMVEQPKTIEPESNQRPVFGQSITPDYIECEEYENIEFVCRLIPISDPTMKIEWTVNGKPLQESSRITNEHEFGVVRLRIKRCEAEDSGIYQCKAKNSLGEAISTGSLRVHGKGLVQCETLHPAGLDAIRQLENPKQIDHLEELPIQQAPKFLTHIIDYIEKDEGESVHFECCLGPVDDPDLKTEWFFNGRPLVTGSRFHTIDDFGFIVLDIDWLFPRDTGEYVCKATNKYGSDITRTVLRVRPDKNIVLDSQLDNPMIIDKLRQLEFPDVEQEKGPAVEPDKPAHFVQHLRSKDNKQQFIEGDNVHFEARVGPATDGNLTVEWFHNDQPLISGHRFKPTFDFGHIQLDILYVYPEDAGVYKCVARNLTGLDVSQYEINVTGKPSLVYQSQLPKEMVGGVKKITDMEAQWNKPYEEADDEEPAEKCAPQFVLKPKAYTAFEGSCARFCCRIMSNPRARLTWILNGQTVVTGSRYKLTYDGMYHLIVPKCQLSDAGKLEVYARNPLGECFATTELKVKRKVDDYRGVLKNSPNPWYDEQSLKVYQKHRSSQDLSDDEEFMNQFQQLKLKIATEQQVISPNLTNEQIVGYMEPETPDVNLLAAGGTPTIVRTQSPLVEPGDMHPVVVEQQAVMAPAPSTIQRAFKVKDNMPTIPEQKSFHQLTGHQSSINVTQRENAQQQSDEVGLESGQLTNQQAQWNQHDRDKRHVFGLDLPRYSKQQQQQQQHQQQQSSTIRGAINYEQQQHEQQQRSWMSQQQRAQQQQQTQQDQHLNYQDRMRDHNRENQSQQQQQQKQARADSEATSSSSSLLRQQSPAMFDSRLPPPSPESKVHGKEVHSHTHKQTQLERRSNKEIKREIIEKEIFEQEHKGMTKDNFVRGNSRERSSTPTSDITNTSSVIQQQQQQMIYGGQQQQFEQTEQNVVLEENMFPPEFIEKIQPCQAIDGDEARFECSFIGDPKPTITWYRESKLIKPSNLYSIIIDSQKQKSTLIIRRVHLNSNAVYTVKAENLAGSAKSSANLVVEPHPAPASSDLAKTRGGVALKIDSASYAQQQQQQQQGANTTTTVTTTTTNIMNESRASGGDQSLDSSQSDLSLSAQQKVVKSVKTRKLKGDEMSSLIKASPEGLVAPTFLHTIHDTTSRPGELARLDARLIGSKPMEVKWLKNGERLRPDRSHKLVLEGDLYTLLILECSQKDEGFYECNAVNRIGEACCGAHLIINNEGRLSATGHHLTGLTTGQDLNSRQQFITSTSASAGSEARQQQQHQSASSFSQQMTTGAKQSSSGSAGFQQQFEQNVDQASGERKHFGVTKHFYNNPLMDQYALTTATTNDGNVIEQQNRSDNILRLIKRLENQQVREGKSIILRCQISSFPIAEVQWYKHQDKLIKPSKYFRIYKDNDETYCLKILETFPEDQGEYKCVARAPNGKTSVETSATITVIPNSPK